MRQPKRKGYALEPETAEKIKVQKRGFARCFALLERIPGWRRRGRRGNERLPWIRYWADSDSEVEDSSSAGASSSGGACTIDAHEPRSQCYVRKPSTPKCGRRESTDG